jgi:hypothetical protein
VGKGFCTDFSLLLTPHSWIERREEEETETETEKGKEKGKKKKERKEEEEKSSVGVRDIAAHHHARVRFNTP